MPQPTQHSLIHVLLLWTTILSIVQAVFIILFFTTGHRGQSQNSSAVAAPSTFQANITPPPPPDHGFAFGKGKMFSYKATEVEGELKWTANDPKNDLVSENGKDLVIKSDGYYYLNLQITLSRDMDKCPCNGTRGSECKVLLEESNENETLLEGWINANTCSTGLLGKVMKLVDGATLKFTINMPPNKVNETESLTHLAIICMVKA